jgi:hypothetical protein
MTSILKENKPLDIICKLLTNNIKVEDLLWKDNSFEKVSTLMRGNLKTQG